MTNRIYIAGPMSGRDDYNYPAFNRAAERLRAEGWTVENPAEIGARFGTPVEISSLPELLCRVTRLELETVKTCDAIYMLQGWEKSTGARVELAAAISRDLVIILEPADNAAE